MISASEALERLREGNHRFVAGKKTADVLLREIELGNHLGGQEPFAVILGCSDSRVPVEIIFDQGLGDLFVVRVAGNIVTPPVVGSIEFAAEQLGARLVVVMGHSMCGAVQASVQDLLSPTGSLSRNWRSVVDGIRPSVEGLLTMNPAIEADALERQAVRANISASTSYLRKRSETLGRLIQEEGLLVLGAECSLETGVVDFFDGLPQPG